MITRARPELRQAGISLVEVLVAMTLMMSIVPILGPMMVSSMRSANEVQTDSAVLDELRLQISAIRRELRSAECIHAPDPNTSANRLSFTTTANGEHYLVTYEVVDGELVRTRDGEVRSVGRGLVNDAVFQHNSTPRLTIDIALSVHLEGDETAKNLGTTITGRNAWLTLSCNAPS